MSEDEVVTQEQIEAAKARDERVARVELAAIVEAEVQSSRTVQVILEAAAAEATDAIEAWVECNPRDADRVTELQNTVRRARSIGAWIASVIEAGLQAERSIRDDDEANA